MSDSDCDSEECVPIPLVEERKNIIGYLCVTITHPHTVAFLNKTCQRQKSYLDRIWDNCCQIGKYGTEFKVHKFEHHDNGMVHLHGIVSVDYDKFNIAGVVSDMARIVHKHMPKKYSQFKVGSYHQEWMRYKQPCVCIQYKKANDEYLAEFEEYMLKDIDNNFLN